MIKYTLESILSEILNERENLSPEIIKKIDRFGELNMEMEKAREKLDSIRREYKNIESELLPILEELDEYSSRTIKTQRYLIHIKKMGFNRTMFNYSKVLDEVLKGANEETQKMIGELEIEQETETETEAEMKTETELVIYVIVKEQNRMLIDLAMLQSYLMRRMTN